MSILTRLLSESTGDDCLIEFEIDSDGRRMRYEFAGADARPVSLRGFAPSGWEAPVRATLEPPAGVLPVSATEVANLLDGLGSIETAGADARNPARRIVRVDSRLPAFDSVRDTSTLIGVCSRRLSIAGLFADVAVSLEPAVVTIERTPAEAVRGRLRAMHLAVDVSCAGAHVPGVGDIGVEVLTGPGAVVAQTCDADFPADMLLTIRMLFRTPFGPIVGDLEHYVGEGIERFPPFGAELRPAKDRIGLVDAAGRRIGELQLGPLVPLFHAGTEGVPETMPCRA